MTWQPIETAPKEKMVILVIDGAAEKKPVKLVSFLPALNLYVDINTGVPVRHPTHWHPISPLPDGLKKIPRKKTGSKNPDRDEQIITQYYQGKSVNELAKKYEISCGRVWQIAKNYRRKIGGDRGSSPVSH